MAHHRDGEHRCDHQPDGQHAYRAGVGPQLAQVREEGRGVEQGRQEEQQDEIRLETDVGHAGNEAESQPAQHQQDGVGNADQACHHCQSGHGHEEPEDDQFDVLLHVYRDYAAA